MSGSYVNKDLVGIGQGAQGPMNLLHASLTVQNWKDLLQGRVEHRFFVSL